MMLNEYEVYTIFSCIKLHFITPAYDYKKYHGKSPSFTLETFKSNPCFIYKKLAEKYHSKERLVRFLVPIIFNNPSVLSHQVLIYEECYHDWEKRVSSMEYFFRQEMVQLFAFLEENLKTFNDLFFIEEYQTPLLIRLVNRKIISPESLLVLNSFLHFLEKWDKITNDIFLSQILFPFKKYNIFFSISDSNKYKKILKEVKHDRLQDSNILRR